MGNALVIGGLAVAALAAGCANEDPPRRGAPLVPLEGGDAAARAHPRLRRGGADGGGPHLRRTAWRSSASPRGSAASVSRGLRGQNDPPARMNGAGKGRRAAPVRGPGPARPERPAPNVDRAVGRIAQLNPERLRPHTVLPAMSDDGRYVAVTQYKQAADRTFVAFRRVRDEHTMRRFPFGWDGEGVARINRALSRGAFRTLRELPFETPQRRHPGRRRAGVKRWKAEALEVRYDPGTGGLAFYDRTLRLIGQTVIPARSPTGTEHIQDSAPWGPADLIPDVSSVFTSRDGEVIAVSLALCSCSCTIDPYWRIFRREDLPMPE